MSTFHRVLCQVWEDFFPSLGIRLLGYSLHLDEAGLEHFTADYVQDMYQRQGFRPRPARAPYWTEVPAATYEELQCVEGKRWRCGLFCKINRLNRPPIPAAD